MDAYEFSFVAVPAQRSAGVIKGLGAGRCLKELAEEFGAQAEYRALYKQAELGRRYEKHLCDEVVRLCLSLSLGVEEPVLRGVMAKASAQELMTLKSALEARVAEMYPVKCQLPGALIQGETVERGFLI